jgi:hypothetical protein
MRFVPGRRSLSVGCAAVATVLLVGACTAPPSDPTTSTTTTTYTSDPTQPTIQSFTVKSTVGPAPSLVTLAWNVSDANLDSLTCQIDGDGDGVFETTVLNCQIPGSRNVAIPAAAAVTATLRVSDGSTPQVTTTTSFTVPSSTVTESFDITLRGVESLPAGVAAAFTAAAERWQRIIVRGFPDVNIGTNPSCLPAGSAPLPTPIDDIVVDVSTPAIDGPGGILGQAGPTCVLLSTELGVHGIMKFDSADVANMLADGSLGDVIAHELGHVLGVGTLWDMTWAGTPRRLLSGAGSTNPTFTGARAVAEYSLLGRTGDVPVENSGGSGTRDSHWRESTFKNELMTGFINPGINPLSRLSIASLADMTYRVDLNEANSYQLSALTAALKSASADDYGEMLRPPVGAV